MTFNSLIQSASDIKEIISTNDATIQGILLGVVIALAIAVVYLYKENKNLKTESFKMLERTFEITIKQKEQYFEWTQLMDKMLKNKD